MIGPLAASVLLTVLAVAMLLAFVRLIRGPDITDRVVALDLVTTTGVAVGGIYAAAFGQMVFLDVAIVTALISFIGTVAFARYLEEKGRGR